MTEIKYQLQFTLQITLFTEHYLILKRLIMKKFILPLLTLAMAGTTLAQTVAEDPFIAYFYANKISQNGKYVGSGKKLAGLYMPETGQYFFYEDGTLGLGNSVTNTGVSVGYVGQNGVIFLPDESYYVPEGLDKFTFSTINSITNDLTRLCGFIANPIKGPAEIPFYCDIAADGTVGPVKVLPYPEKDLLGTNPQFIVANWISNDGKTILGNVLSNDGHFTYPIVFKEGSDGEWSYTLPTDNSEFFNPENIELPENPLEAPDAPKYPSYEDYMSADSYEMYRQELEDYFMGISDILPDPLDWMDEDQQQAFEDAEAEYDDYMNDPVVLNAYRKWLSALTDIVNTSVLFGLNDLALSPDGKYFTATQGNDLDSDETALYIWVFNNEDGSYRKIESKYTNIIAQQILSDGTIVAANPYMSSPITTYMLLPGADDFISVKEYLEASSPVLYTWMEENLYSGTGHVPVADDKSIWAGGIVDGNLFPDSPTAEEMGSQDIENATYVFGKAPYSGVKAVEMQVPDGIYEVYNLQGVKVLRTADKNDIDNLLPGLYMVNGKKIMVRK